MDVIVQGMIIVCSCGSIFLFSSKRYFRYGFVVGLIEQPFWIYTTVKTELWGMFVVTLWFTFSHIRGLRNNFRRLNG